MTFVSLLPVSSAVEQSKSINLFAGYMKNGEFMKVIYKFRVVNDQLDGVLVNDDKSTFDLSVPKVL